MLKSAGNKQNYVIIVFLLIKYTKIMKKLTFVLISLVISLMVTSCEKNEPETTDISIKDFKFSPATLTIKAGTTVKWTNNDSAAHTATDNNQAFDSGTIGSGKSYEFKFDHTGTYSYICNFHQSMKGTIIVE